jgi:hypothetical protein
MLKKNAVVIQLKRIALTANSLEIVGSATFNDVPINGVKNEASVAISKIAVLSIFLSLTPSILLSLTDICVSISYSPHPYIQINKI